LGGGHSLFREDPPASVKWSIHFNLDQAFFFGAVVWVAKLLRDKKHMWQKLKAASNNLLAVLPL
jgi:hypothetical protein